MASLVEELGRLGYVAVGPDPTDGRARLVTLTGDGRRAQATLTRLSREAERRLAHRIGEEALETLRAHLLAATADET